MLAPVWLVAKFVLLLAGLLVPGAMLMRALRLPQTAATCFVGSAVALYATVLGLQLSSIPISLGSLAVGLAAITLVARLRRGGTVPPTPNEPSLLSRAGVHSIGAWTLIYVLFWGAVLLRAWREPLAGPDVEFRWSFLAEQMLRHGSLDFYPPRSAAHFLRYFWVESIPPGASALHAWAYACAGRFSAAWTVPAVVLQLWSLHELIWRAGESAGGARGGRFAIFAAAACPLLTWSVLLGQETGLTALALAGIAWALLQWQSTRTPTWSALAGIFATLGAAAREYGLIFPLLAAIGLWLVRADRRGWYAFLAPCALAAVWPLRTFILTGNPFYSLSLGGFFPINAVFHAWIQHDAGALSATLRTVPGWTEITRYLLVFAPLAVFGWAWLFLGLRSRRPIILWLLGAIVVVFSLWAASVRYTNGGVFYSLRVLSPALVLGAIGAGIGLATLAEKTNRTAKFLPAMLSLMILFTLPATLALPQNHGRAPWREWPAFAAKTGLVAGEADPTVALALKLLASTPPAERGLVLADAPGFQRRFADSGIPVAPLWSPQADWLFDSTASAGDIARRWRASRVTLIIVTKWQTNLDFLNQHSRWSKPPLQTHLVGETTQTAIFSIRAVE